VTARADPSEPERIVVLGRCTGAFGVAGAVRIQTFTETADGLLQFRKWWVKTPGQDRWREMDVMKGRTQGDAVVAELAGVQDRDAALAMKGAEIGIARERLPEPADDEIYWSDLVGMSVVNREGRALGRVQEVIAHGAHPLLSVMAAEGIERLIPCVPAVLQLVDVEAKRIDVDWGEDY